MGRRSRRVSGGSELGANRVLRMLGAYAILDTSRRRGLARAMKWNDIPFDENASPVEKAHEFDLQIRENGGDPEVTHRQANEEERS